MRRLRSQLNALKLKASRRVASRHDPDDLHTKSTRSMVERGIDVPEGEERLGAALKGLSRRPFDHRRDSVHWLLFAALAAEHPQARVLEIGTYDAAFTSLLAALFPDGEIETVELPTDDPILVSSYRRSDPAVLAAMERRLNVCGDLRNVVLHRCNDAFLLDHVKGPFDFIWVDGGHHFPDVAWDLAQSHHLCRMGGAVLVDDIVPPKGRSTAYVSQDSRRAVEYIAERTGEKPAYFLKRTEFTLPSHAKYVAMLRKPGGAVASNGVVTVHDNDDLGQHKPRR